MASNDTNSDEKVLTLAEVQQLSEDKNKCIMIINNNVYDVTKFLDEVGKYLLIDCELYNEIFFSIQVVKKS
jgi:cytochrome b involved in lipid metabolism